MKGMQQARTALVWGLISVFSLTSVLGTTSRSSFAEDGVVASEKKPPGDRPKPPRPRPTATPTPTQTPSPEPTETPEPTPSPEPSPTATPTPTPTTAPTTAPSEQAPDLEAARRAGHDAGIADGSREGRRRGADEGRARGLREGYDAGFQQCVQEERQRAFDSGLREGYVVGEQDGASAGIVAGRNEGQARGQPEGAADGDRRADQDSKLEATPAGTQRGIEEAESSDASERGYQDGLVAGERAALEYAIAHDYQRGRQNYREERYSAPVDSEDEFTQEGESERKNREERLFGGTDQYKKGGQRKDALGGSNKSDPSFSHPSEREAYRQGYQHGYRQGYDRLYESSFQAEYRTAYARSQGQGCAEARRRDYREDYNQGYAEGRQQGYQHGYQLTYDESFRGAYEEAFRAASEESYRQSYAGHYQRHFEDARIAAYQSRAGEIYRVSFDRGKSERFDQTYPEFARQQFERGRQDEAEEFARRPLRLESAEAMESDENGLMEPGEALRVAIQLRNFAEQGVAGQDVRVKLEALDPRSSVISISEAVLSKDLRQNSLTTAKGLLEFRLNESVVNRISRFKVTVFHQGNIAGESYLDLTARFQLAISFVQAPQLSEGLPTAIALRIRNQSREAIGPGVSLRMVSNPDLVEILKDQLPLGTTLQPGEETVVNFAVVARTHLTSVRLSLAVEADGGIGRRIGLLDESRQVPVLNDYKISVLEGASALRSVGIVRVEYRIRNVNSRFLLKGLQLTSRILGKNGETFAILGPNPQYIRPVLRGGHTEFVVPILVKTDGADGVLELEVHEDGNKVVIHRIAF